MRIYTKAGDLAFKVFEFPDSQPHFELLTADREFKDATVEMPIRNPRELLVACLAGDALQRSGYSVSLDIRYLMGARMDRPLSRTQPFTLNVVAAMLNTIGFRRVRILDAHSQVACDLLGATNLLPEAAVRSVIASIEAPIIVIPDKGAVERGSKITATYRGNQKEPWIQGNKARDPQTGRISGIRLDNATLARGRNCLIIDDICDGGATFSMIGKGLKSEGAKSVNLFVTHGIFSKGVQLADVDLIYTTDSYANWMVRGFGPTCVPVSMKELP